MMEHPEVTGSLPTSPAEMPPPGEGAHVPLMTSPFAISPGTVLSSQAGEGICARCGGMGAANPEGAVMETPAYIYALGRITPRFPSLALEKELAQATGRAETAGLTDRQALHTVLAQRANRYLARQLCYVLTIEGLETYIVRPRDPVDFDLLVDAIRPTPRPTDVDVVIGVRGPLAPPELCNGLMVPIAVVDQLYSFDIDSLVAAIPRPELMTAEQFGPTAEELFMQIMQMADNAGATDEHRALNYLAVRYPAIYATAAERHAQNGALTAVEVRPSRLSGVRKIVDVIFSYTHRQMDVTEKVFVRVDVTEEFPFLVTRLSPYYER
jgi:PatG Domain